MKAGHTTKNAHKVRRSPDAHPLNEHASNDDSSDDGMGVCVWGGGGGIQSHEALTFTTVTRRQKEALTYTCKASTNQRTARHRAQVGQSEQFTAL